MVEQQELILNDLLKCRLCLLLTKHSVNIFDENNLNIKLSKFCNISINNEDNLPKTICLKCLNELNRFSDFYNRIQENQKILLLKLENQIEKITENEFVDYEKNDMKLENCIIEIIETRNIEETDEILDEITQENEKTIIEEIDIDYPENSLQINDNNSISNELNSSENNENIYLNIRNKTKKINHKIKIQETNSNSMKTIILPSQKSKYRISLDEKLREFFDLICKKCNFTFLTFATMKKHMEIEHCEQGFVICCNKKLYRREAIMEHVNNHLNPTEFICNICDQVCKSKVTLKIHLKQHIPKDERPFRCDQCEQSFVLNSQLKSHHKSHLTDDEKKFVCDECGKAFAFKFVLEKHKQHMHIKEKNYMCEICARSFVDKVNLTAHKRIHDTTLPRLQCPHCDALLKNKITLKIHMRVHNPQTYSCNVCKKILYTKNALMNHIQYVHNEKKYPCNVCKKIFKKSLTLKEHMTTHTGEVLYQCKYCSKKFNAKANMYSHVKKLHTKEWAEERKLKWGIIS